MGREWLWWCIKQLQFLGGNGCQGKYSLPLHGKRAGEWGLPQQGALCSSRSEMSLGARCTKLWGVLGVMVCGVSPTSRAGCWPESLAPEEGSGGRSALQAALCCWVCPGHGTGRAGAAAALSAWELPQIQPVLLLSS